MSTTSLNEAARVIGTHAARKRWGPPRHHNIRDLEPARRERIEAFIEAERNAQAREQAEKGAA